MSAEPLGITLATGAGTTGGVALPVALKKIMEMPPPNILDCDDGEWKVRVNNELRQNKSEIVSRVFVPRGLVTPVLPA